MWLRGAVDSKQANDLIKVSKPRISTGGEPKGL